VKLELKDERRGVGELLIERKARLIEYTGDTTRTRAGPRSRLLELAAIAHERVRPDSQSQVHIDNSGAWRQIVSKLLVDVVDRQPRKLEGRGCLSWFHSRIESRSTNEASWLKIAVCRA
jgi:hypothetical protein